jgi:hypothetical protein
MKKLLSNLSIYLLFITFSFLGCSKDLKDTDINLSYQFIGNKTWYLDYEQTSTISTIKTRTYLGQPTYFINYLKDKTTSDSDGLIGTYSILKMGTILQIQVQAKTISGNPSSYTYEIESIGSKNMILSYVLNNTKTRLFFTSQQ